MEMIHLEIQKRELSSKGVLKKMRREGWIPGILYDSASSKKSQNILLKVQEKPFLKILGPHHSSSAIIELKWESASQPETPQTVNAIIKEIQTDVLTQKPLHIDFQKIKLTEKIEVTVAVHLAGEAPGVKLSGGILEHITRELKISALPKDIPQTIVANISHLEIGQGIFVKDLQVPAGVQILTETHHLIANVVAQKAEEEVPAVAAPTTAEPEVIAKGKIPKEGEEPAAATAKEQEKQAPSK